jgi:hypothetical protein|tara:strand:+ start:63 stop:938 length:876 start_codon:yes stop_codon:yes gene_type:complete
MKTRNRKINKKLIVFDLDETIGHFEEFGRFISGLEYFHKQKWFVKSYDEDAFDKILEKYFDILLHLYPEFFRYGIFKVFEDVLKKKRINKHLKVAIYTNNMGPRSWTIYIKNFIEKKIKHKLFDIIITGFHTNTDKRRTTHNKTHKDLINCSNLPKNIPILFFDDQFHRDMVHNNIKYIHLHPYKMSISFDEMSKRFLENKDKMGKEFEFTSEVSEKEFTNTMHEILLKMGENRPTYRVRKLHVSKIDKDELVRIKKSIKHFTKGTQRRKTNKKNKTRKTKKNSKKNSKKL